jgi:fibronectin-binding autotransporter adhesin
MRVGALFTAVAGVAILFAIAPARPLLATTIAWLGGTSTAWATGSNWAGGTAPVNDSTSDVAAFGFATLPANQPNAGTRSIRGILVGDGGTAVPAFTIAGTQLTIGAAGIIKNAASLQTNVATDVALAAAQTWSNDSTALLDVTGNVALAGHLLTVAGSGTTTLAGVVSGSGGFAKSGLGTAILSGQNTFTGGVTISQGVLQAGATSNKETLGPDSNVLTFTGSGGTLQLFSGLNSSKRSIVLTQAGTIDTNGFTLVQQGVVSGTGQLTKTGSGTLTLAAANTSTGTTAVQGGTLLLTSGSAIADTSAVVLANAAGVMLQLTNQSETIGSISGGGTTGGNITLGSNNLTFGGDDRNTSYGGQFIGANNSGFTKIGSGTTTLANTGTNDAYTGSVTIRAGTLSIAAAETLGSLGTKRTIYLDGGGTLQTTADMIFATHQWVLGAPNGQGIAGVFDVAPGTTATITDQISSVAASGLEKIGGGTLILSGSGKNYDGTTLVSAGTLLLDGALGSAAVTVNSGGTLGGAGTISGTVTVTASGTLSPGGVASGGPGKLTVSQLVLAADSTALFSLVGSGSGAGIGGVDYDVLAVSGASAVTFGGHLLLDFSNTTTFAVGTSFHLFTFSGSSTGDFQSVATLGGLGPYQGLAFATDGNGTWVSGGTPGGQFLRFTDFDGTLVIVPEPSTLVLAAIGCGLLAALRRAVRRRRVGPPHPSRRPRQALPLR